MEEADYVQVILKGCERYIFLYDDGEERAIVEASRGLANNPGLNFCDDDVDCLAQIIYDEGLEAYD